MYQEFFKRIFFTLLREARIGAMSERVSHRFLFERAVLPLPERTGAVHSRLMSYS
ncbi:hypothetical protein [Paraburkholderia sp. BL18I3N2]|uniref:hypothetical protein n=1 Tax=Paraburkholderia sp. BL18I3N2 TaxID=1938799 RepID=UPI0015E6F9BD|nr:hypothetical protein [Paraburkholderia sp. BL18I3N2]